MDGPARGGVCNRICMYECMYAGRGGEEWREQSLPALGRGGGGG